MTEERVEYVEYLSMIIPTGPGFIFRAPPLSYVSNIYYLPFAGIVWICTIALVVLCTLLIYLTFRCSKERDRHLILTDYLLYAVSTICQMGSQLTPKRSSGKLATVIYRNS